MFNWKDSDKTNFDVWVMDSMPYALNYHLVVGFDYTTDGKLIESVVEIIVRNLNYWLISKRWQNRGTGEVVCGPYAVEKLGTADPHGHVGLFVPYDRCNEFERRVFHEAKYITDSIRGLDFKNAKTIRVRTEEHRQAVIPYIFKGLDPRKSGCFTAHYGVLNDKYRPLAGFQAPTFPKGKRKPNEHIFESRRRFERQIKAKSLFMTRETRGNIFDLVPCCDIQD